MVDAYFTWLSAIFGYTADGFFILKLIGIYIGIYAIFGMIIHFLPEEISDTIGQICIAGTIIFHVSMLVFWLISVMN